MAAGLARCLTEVDIGDVDMMTGVVDILTGVVDIFVVEYSWTCGCRHAGAREGSDSQ